MTHLIALSLLVACPATDDTTGDDPTTAAPAYTADVTSKANVSELSHYTTAEALMMLGYLTPMLPAFYLDSEDPEAADCPSQSLNAEQTEWTVDAGDGCTDASGIAWSGSMVWSEIPSEVEGEYGTFSYVMDDLRYTAEWIDEMEDTGDPTDDSYIEEFHGDGTFEMDLDAGTFAMLVSLGYSAESLVTGEVEELSWSGEYAGTMTSNESGYTYAGEGESTVNGLGSVRTVSEGHQWDGEVCDMEYLGGTLSLEGGDNVAVVTFDGATDCDEDRTGTWTLNGLDKGEIKDVGTCSTAGSTPASFLGWLVLPLGLVASRRRRS